MIGFGFHLPQKHENIGLSLNLGRYWLQRPIPKKKITEKKKKEKKKKKGKKKKKKKKKLKNNWNRAEQKLKNTNQFICLATLTLADLIGLSHLCR